MWLIPLSPGEIPLLSCIEALFYQPQQPEKMLEEKQGREELRLPPFYGEKHQHITPM